MAAAADEVQVDLDLDAAPKDAPPKDEPPKVEVVADAAPPKPVLTPDEGLEKLKKQLEEEKGARLAAEARAREAAQAELAARTEVQGSQLDMVTSGIASLKQTTEVLKSQFVEAMSAQDYAKAAELQVTLGENAAKLVALEDGKKRLETAPKPTLRVSDPVEEFAAKLTPQSAQWVREHPEYVRDQRLNQKMLAAHSLALADGHSPDTPGYFKSINETLRIAPDTEVHLDDPMKHAAQEVRVEPRRAPPAAAPVSRSGNGRSSTYRASAEEVEAAELSGLSIEEYVRNREALRKEGWRFN